MKKKLVHLFFAALMVVGAVGCKEREQSELEFSSMQDTAYVTGCITYSLGQDTLSDDYVAEVIKPAVGRKIYVDVPLSSYTSGAQGNKIFTGIVDELGNVSIAIPVKSNGISGATLRYEEFTAERAEYLKMENGKPVFEVRMNKFETPSAIASLPTLMPGTNSIGKEEELRYVPTVIDMKSYAETAVYSGTLLLPYEVSYRTGAYKPAAACNVEITIKDGEDVEEVGYSDAPEFTYGCTTNENGAFSLNLPIKNLRDGFYVVDAMIVPLGEEKFTHYVDVTGKSIELSGVYKLREELLLNSAIKNIVEGVECAIGTRTLKFIPNYTNGITNPILPQAWSDNLAGWVFGEQQFAAMNATAKLSGTVKLAQETAFAIGSYTTSAQTVQITGPYPYDKQLEVLVNADGTFELEIPIENENTTISGWNVTLNQPASIAFTHYASPTKSIVIKEGSYNLYKKIRSQEADWNQLGDFYYKFTPAYSIDTWSSYLAGWVIKEGYDATATINGSIYLAEESGYLAGRYEGAVGRRAQVTIVYSEGNETFVAPIQAEGVLNLTIPAKNATSKYTYSFELLDVKNEEFKHYTKNGSELLEGEYGLYKTDKSSTAEWNTLGAKYYKFTPTSSATNWSDNLIGWYVVPQQKDVARFQLYAQKAYETPKSMFHEAKWTKADKVKATVTVNGTDFDMPVSGQSLFFNLPVDFIIKDGVTGLTISVALEDETAGSTQFTHYPNPYSDDKEVLLGNYKSEDNIYYEYVTANGKVFEIKESAKMLFYDKNGNLPTGYYWDVTADFDAI